MTYDQQYKHLFYTTLWVCRNKQRLFSKSEQIALLNYLTSSMSDLIKVVNFSVLVELANDFEAM